MVDTPAPAPVPEPASLLLLGAGLLGAAAARRQRACANRTGGWITARAAEMKNTNHCGWCVC